MTAGTDILLSRPDFPSAAFLCTAATGTKARKGALPFDKTNAGAPIVNGIIYLVGLVVVVMAILSFLGMH
jgi:hypothetical protein